LYTADEEALHGSDLSNTEFKGASSISLYHWITLFSTFATVETWGWKLQSVANVTFMPFFPRFSSQRLESSHFYAILNNLRQSTKQFTRAHTQIMASFQAGYFEQIAGIQVYFTAQGNVASTYDLAYFC